MIFNQNPSTKDTTNLIDQINDIKSNVLAASENKENTN